MSTNIINMLICFIGGFIGCMIVYGLCFWKGLYAPDSKSKYSFLPFLLSALCCLGGLSLYFNSFYDFIVPPEAKTFAYLSIGTAVIYAAAQLKGLKRFEFFTILLVAMLISSFTPLRQISYFEAMPMWAGPIITAAAWAVFAFCWRYLNALTGLVALCAFSFCLGIASLGWLNGLPMLFAYIAAAWGGMALTVFLYNKEPARIKLSSSDCSVLGFLLGFLLFYAFLEKSGPCVLTFSFFLIGEMIFGTLNMLFNGKISGLNTYMAYYEAQKTGMPINLEYRQISRILVLLLIMGCFELYAPNDYSVPVFALVLTLWYLYRLQNWQIGNQTFREINREVISEIKTNIKQISKNSAKD